MVEAAQDACRLVSRGSDPSGSLSGYMVSCHAKDVTTVGHYPYHMTETYSGGGVLDYGMYQRELAKLDDAIPLMIEHLTVEQPPGAVYYLLGKAAEVGVSFVKPAL